MELAPYAPHVALVPRHVDVFVGADRGWIVQYKATINKRQSIASKDGRLLTGEWAVEFLEWPSTLDPSVATTEGCGAAEYHPELDDMEFGDDESFSASVFVKPEVFRDLIQSALAGSVPQGIRLSIRGLTFGVDHLGRDKVWDIEANRRLAIVEWGMRMTPAEEDLGDTTERAPGGEDQLASRADVAQLVLAALRTEAQRIITPLTWLVGLAAATFLISLIN